MNDQTKTAEELVKELQELRQKHDELKTVYEKDIIELRQAEKDLRETRQKFSDIITNLDEAYYSCTLDGLLMEHNVAFKRIFGFDPNQDMKGVKIPDFWQNPEKRLEYLDKLMNEGFIRNYLVDTKTISGKKTVVMVNSHLVKAEDGKIVRIEGTLVDFTERMQMEEALREREQEYRTLFEGANDAIFIMNEEKFIECNLMTLDIFGCKKKEDIINYSPWEFSPSQQPDGCDSKEKAFNYIHAALNGVPQRFYWKHAKKNRTLFDAEVSLNQVKLGNRIYIQAIVRDITEGKKVEQELQYSHEAFKNYFELGSVGMCVTSPEKKWIEVNARLSQMFGYSKEEFQQHTWADLTHPDDLAADLELFNQVLSGDRDSYDLDKRFIRKDGSILYTTLSVTCQRNEDGTLHHILASLIDITDRKLAEHDYQREKAFMDKLFDSSPEAISASDEQGLIVRVNTKFLELFGFAKEEVIGKKIDNLIAHGEYHDEAVEISKMAHSGRTIELESIRHRKDGTSIDVSIIATPIAIGDLFFGGYGIYRDITERKRTENALRESEELYRNLIEKMPDGVYKSTHEGRFLEVNPAMVRMLGYDNKEELLEIDIKTQLYFDPSDRESIELEEKLVELVVYRLKRKDGSEIWVEDHGWYNVNEHGKILIHEGILRDVSDRILAEASLKKSEREYRNLFENANDSILIFKPESEVILDANNHACITYGFSKSEFIGLSLKQISENVQRGERAIQELLQRGTYKEFETVEFSKDGRPIQFLVNLSVIEYDGKTAILSIHRDITERKHTELQLAKQAEELKELNATKDKFFSIIAHDLRNPFNSFLGFTQMMVNELPTLTSEEIQKIALNMRNSANNLFNLLDNLLQWSRLQRGVISFAPESFLLMPEIAQNMKSVLDTANNKSVEISFNIPEDLEVYGDLYMLGSTIRNLASNAVKFSLERGKIIIAAKPIPGNLVEISVKDTGIGMNKNMIDHLFRLDKATNRIGTEADPSTGLGLIICKDFIEKNGGTIWIESEEGKGSTFYFTLKHNYET